MTGGWPFLGLEPGAYRTCVVDPPWRFDVTQRLGGRGRRPAAASKRYSTLSVHDLADLPVGRLLDDEGHLWLHVTNAVIASGAHKLLLDAWHVRPITVLTWCKPGGNGLGTYLRGSTEHAVLAVKGWGTVPAAAWPSTWFQAAREPHSVKSPAFGDIVEHVSPGPYVELFQRQTRIGWDGWGWGHEIGATA